MPIDKLTISNFKGIAEKTAFDIKPITLFIGPNSSGKSSCIHALAALAQTVKIANSKLPIVLDDEYAQVHLGRFIEVIHSSLYTDSIEIGVSLDRAGMSVRYSKDYEVVGKEDEVQATYSFKSTKRTQDITMEKAEFNVGTKSLNFRKSGANYTVRFNSKLISSEGSHQSGLKLSFSPIGSKNSKTNEDDKEEIFNAYFFC